MSHQAATGHSQYIAMADTQTKKTVLVIGGGAVGAIAALNLEVGGLAEVTLVLRSNFDAVKAKGFDITSCDHGHVQGWRPSISKFYAMRIRCSWYLGWSFVALVGLPTLRR